MFVALQLWAVYENYDNIREFNAANAALEFARTAGGPRVDRRVFDPNDEAFDVRKKWRCVLFKGAAVAASEFGFRSHDGVSPARFASVGGVCGRDLHGRERLPRVQPVFAAKSGQRGLPFSKINTLNRRTLTRLCSLDSIQYGGR